MPGKGRGFLTIVQNNDTTDYLKLAYAQALSIKLTQKNNNYAVIVDAETEKLITARHRKVFDHVITLTQDDAKDDAWKLGNEWQVFQLTPFYETMKVESDILFPVSIDHWWDGLQKYEVCMTSHVLDHEGNEATARNYRHLFDKNNLPDLYTGLMYFRYSRTASDLFRYAQYVYNNWEMFKAELLKECFDEQPTTDVVFAIAAQLIGQERCSNPGLSYPTFVHMKGAMLGLGTNDDWTESFYAQVNPPKIIIGFNGQKNPVHYFKKNFVTDNLIHQYERAYDERSASRSV